MFVLFNLGDLYPDTAANVPAITAKEWFQGLNAQPIMMSMQTGQKNINELTNKSKQTHNSNLNRKLLNDSNYNIHNNNNNTNNNLNNMNGVNKNKENEIKNFDNNSKKFAFLAQQTIPDYRSQTQLSEKCQKTSTNQSTKFHQLQAIFGHQGANIKDIANMQNNLISSRNGTPNGSLENINLTYSENEVSLSRVLYTYTLE